MNTETPRNMGRILEIHKLLKSGRKIFGKELAERFNCSQRTVIRLVEAMRRDLHAPIPDPPLPEGYYYTDRTFELPGEVQIEEGEFFAFVVAQKVVQGLGPDSPYARQLQASLKKLSRHLAGRMPVRAEDLFHRGYDFDLGPLREVKPEVLAEVDRALSRKVPLEMVYHSLHRGLVRTERVVEPYFLKNFRGDWYLVAFCRKADGLRTFALSRIEECSIVEGQGFRPRPDFDAEKHFENSLGIFTTGDPGPCRIWFSEKAARWILERMWHESQRSERLEDGSIELTLDVGPTVEVVRWILAHGADARPVAPQSLVDEIDRHLDEMS